jgi:hypothetical protein
MTTATTQQLPTVTPPEPALQPHHRPGLLGRLARDTAYVVSGFVLGVLGFVVVLTGLALGLGLVVVWVGLPVLIGTVLAARGLAVLERHRLATLQGRASSPWSPAYAVAPAGSNRLRRLFTPLRDPQSWLDALWALVSFVTGTLAFVLTAAWWTAALSGLTYWFWQQWVPDGPDDRGLAELLGWGEGRGAESLLQLAIGVVALLTLPWVVRGSAALHAGTADALLNLRGRVRGPQV